MKIKWKDAIGILIIVISLSLWWSKTQDVEVLQNKVLTQKTRISHQQTTIQALEKKNDSLKKEKTEEKQESNHDTKTQSLLTKNKKALQAYFSYSSIEARDQVVNRYLTPELQKESQEAEENHDHEQGEISSILEDHETFVSQQGNVYKTYNDSHVKVSSQGKEQELHIAVTFTWKNESGNWLISLAHFQVIE
jgi:hypothetical protein